MNWKTTEPGVQWKDSKPSREFDEIAFYRGWWARKDGHI